MSILQSLLPNISWLSYPILIVVIIVFIAKVIAFINIKSIETVFMAEETKIKANILHLIIIYFVGSLGVTMILLELYNIDINFNSTNTLLSIYILSLIISFPVISIIILFIKLFLPYRRYFIEEGKTKLYIIKTTKDDIVLLSNNPVVFLLPNNNDFFILRRKDDFFNKEIKEEVLELNDFKVFIKTLPFKKKNQNVNKN